MTRKPAAVALVLSLAVLALVVLPAAGLAAKGGSAGSQGGGGKGGGGGSYSVWVDQSAPYRFGQMITVGTNTPVYPDNQGPFVELNCYQGGTKVLGVTHAGFPGGWYYRDPFTLGPTQMWTSDGADCTVSVFHMSRNKLANDASASFRVDG